MVSRCLSTAGVRFLVILSRPGVRLSSRSAYRPRPDPDGVSTFRTHETRPGWVPSIPRGRRCPSGPATITDPRLPYLIGNVPAPRHNDPSCEALLHEASTRVQAIHPSGLPLARHSRMERERLRLSPELRTPPSRATHVGAGTGHQARTRNNALRHRPSLQPCVFTQCVRPRVALVKAGPMRGAGR